MIGEVILIALIVIGIVGRSPIISTAACVLLIIKLVHLERYLPAMERRGLELGLLFLTFSVLVPFATGRIQLKEIMGALTSWAGWLALAGGALATYINGKGLEMLRFDPQLIVGMVVGSILGIVFLRGIPVGPLMAAGITVILYKLFTFLADKLT